MRSHHSRGWQGIEIPAQLVEQLLRVVALLLQSLNDVRRRLRRESRIVELAVGVRDDLLQPRDFLDQLLALGCNIDLAFKDHRHIKLRRRMPRKPLGYLMNKSHLAHTSQTLYDCEVFINNSFQPRINADLNRYQSLLFDADLLPQRTDLNDQFLQERHSVQSVLVDRRVIGLREPRQRNRLRRWIAVIHRMPDFLGQERHEWRQQPERCLKDTHERSE